MWLLIRAGAKLNHASKRGPWCSTKRLQSSADTVVATKLDNVFMMTSSNGNISVLLALCVGNSPVTGEFPTQRPATLGMNKKMCHKISIVTLLKFVRCPLLYQTNPTGHNDPRLHETSSNGNISRVTGPLCWEFPAQRPVTRSFDVFFDLRLNKRVSKQSWGWWFETPSHPLWRHCNVSQASLATFRCPFKMADKMVDAICKFCRHLKCSILSL